MPKGDHPGEFQQLVLLALIRLGDNAYGMRVRQKIEQRVQRPVSIGAVYATLDRLGEKGFVTSHMGDPMPERGGRAKRYFQISKSGAMAFRRSQAARQRMGALLPNQEPAT